MDELYFVDKDLMPDRDLLITALQEAHASYALLEEKLSALQPQVQREWKYYGKKNGWLLKHLDRKRNLFFLVVYNGYFKLSFSFGQNLVTQILKSDMVRADIKTLLEQAKKYAEGTAILIPVNTACDVQQALALLNFKLGIPKREE